MSTALIVLLVAVLGAAILYLLVTFGVFGAAGRAGRAADDDAGRADDRRDGS